MNPFRGAFVWPLVAATGGAVAYMLREMPPEVNSAILTAFGLAWSAASGFAFQILRKFEDVRNIQGLDSMRKEQLKRKLSARRKSFFFKWAECFASALLVMLAGGLIKTSLAPHWLFLGIGYVFAAITLVLGILIVVEYLFLTRLGGDLAEKLKKSTDRHEFLRKVRA